MAYLAVLTALGVALLFLVGVVPAGRLWIMAVASLPVGIAVMMYGYGWALGVFAATALLSCLLFPASALEYLVFFGYYPIVKSLFERLPKNWMSWALKYLLFAVVVFVLWKASLLGEALAGRWYILCLAGAASFAAYDFAFSILIRFYLERIARFIS